tara:strand:- start:1720 stop:2037 length:318 start_codon:yes stop_codon:yes gene_type:complete
MIDIIDAVIALDPNAVVTMQGEEIEKLTWEDGNPNNITNQQILNKKAELESQYTNEKYKRNRAKAYPALSDFVEAYTEKEILDKTDKWDAYVENYNKVRSDFPKP